MGNQYAPGMLKWNLRFGVTSRCNFRCRYCLPAGLQEKVVEPTSEDVIEVLQVAYNIGIRRVHYTGGEPTIRSDFPKIIKEAKGIGFEQQIITTNGYRLYRIIDELIENGLTRVIVSLDTLDKQRNFFVTRAGFFDEAIKGIEACVQKLPTLTKMSCCTMRTTLRELNGFVNWAQELNSKGYRGELAIKLNQFFPSNPVQLSVEGQNYWKEEFVEESEILQALREIGELQPVLRETIEGDNPSYNYYEIGETKVKVAVLAMFSWDYPCGGCWKLRISPQGFATTCINQKNPSILWGKNLEEKTRILSERTSYRASSKFDQDFPARKHYRAQLGELRFDKVVGEERSIGYFEDILEKGK
jgi:GTP 3',8-cyclase